MTLLDHRLLRNSHPRLAGPYLHKIIIEGQTSTAAISQELLDAVTRQSLPPRVYELWLCACPDETAIALGLQQNSSLLIRRGAIKAFRRWFRTSRCVDIWRAIGGTEGIVALLATFSVIHVREFSKQIGRCSTSTALVVERQTLVTELVYAVVSRFFPDSAIKNPDERPLWKSYAELVFASTPEARDIWIGEKGLPDLDMFKVMQTNTEHYQQQCLKKAIAGEKDLHKYSALFVSLPAKMSEVDSTVPQSMEFAALFLETLLEHDVQLVKSGGERKLGAAFVTIIRRLARREISEDFTFEMINLISRCASQRVVQEASSYDNNYTEYQTDLARLWMRSPATFEAPLSGLVKVSDRIDSSDLATVIPTVPTELRYRLLRWLIISQHNIDIDNADHLSRFRYPIPWGLLVALPKPEARGLVDRIVSVKGENDWLNAEEKIPTDLPSKNRLDVLRCCLMDDDGARREEAMLKTSQFQRAAEKDRDAQGRMEWAAAAGYMAVTSGLDTLRDVFVWARRFNRDPLSSKLYASDSFMRDTETLSLLSGIPERPTATSSKDLITTSVRKGNEIALLLLETAAMCQSEPSFYVNHWSAVQHLFADFVKVRFQRVKKLRSRLSLSKDDINKLVWKPTLDALLEAEERIGLDERHPALMFNDMYGPLATWRDVDVKDPDPSALWFINELALRRDALWQQHRCSLHTSVMTLEAPWPRGLPVQALLSAYINGKPTGEGLPFVMARAKSVVFTPREDALRAIPEDRDERAAIGCFVENYRFALRVYVFGCDKQEQQRRSSAAWQYATTKLSEARLSPQEAILYWQGVFTDAKVQIPKPNLDFRSPPKLPELDACDDKPEWNPDLGSHPSIEDRNLVPTCLDCITALDRPADYPKNWTTNDAFIARRPSINRSQVPEFWDLSQYVIAFDARDGFIAAALLLVDALTQADAKVLSEAFPRDGSRFPAVFLDSDFVDNQRSFDTFPPALLNDTPPALLEQLTSALFAKLSATSKPSPSLIKWAFTYLKLLAWSDQPARAIHHIVHVVINLPEHSSWHRVMLHPGVLKRLSAQQSKTLVATLAEAINEKSGQRKKAATVVKPTAAEPNGDEKPTQAPYVKVTTVKLLAQLMRRAEFIGEGFTVEILVKMFTEATHIDVRAAIVDTLLSIAESTNTLSIERDIMTMLETHVVPFAAELSERSPMTDQSWAEYGKKIEPPLMENLHPARDALLAFVERSKWKKDELKTRELVQRLLLPLIRKAAANGQRWLKIVLSAHDAQDLYADDAMLLYPSIPHAFGAYELYKHLLEKHPAHMPAAYYNDLHKLLVFFARESDEYQGLRDRFNAMDPPPVDHDSYFRLSTHASFKDYDPNTAEFLKTAIFATAADAASNELLTPAQLQAHEREMIDIRLARFDQDPKRWAFLVDCHKPPLRMKESMQVAWYSYCRPLVEYMVERIDATRTTAWQRDPQRQPARLPDAFPLRLWLLTYPSRPWRADTEQELRRDKFVAELHYLIDQLAGNGRPYHAHFELVVAAAKKCYEKDWAFIAWRLGTLQEGQTRRDFTVAELLHVDLAERLLQGAQQPVTKEVMAGVGDMLADWRQCLDEDVRDRGIVTTALLKDKAKDKNALPME
jgi:hypothetical protein